ncbi:MAG: hypothetical protein ACYC1E_01920 [Propionibacteriaceae bacterium]
MSSMLVAFVMTIVVLVAVLIGLRQAGSSAPRISSWFSLVAGALALLAIAEPMVDSAFGFDRADQIGRIIPWLPVATMTLGLVALATGVFAFVRQEHSWRTWVGLATGALVTLFWVLFGFGELLSPC